jgi:hypothetical protein
VADPILYANGFGGSVGSTHATLSRLMSTGTAWYVHSGTGVDAVSPRGKDRTRPLATTAQAYSNATNGDFIVYLSGHVENLSAILICNKHRITFFSEGQGSSRARLGRTANMVSFTVTTGLANRWENIYFPASAVAAASARFNIPSAGHVISNCYFESGANDTGPVVRLDTGGDYVSIEDTTFISTATLVTAQPSHAVEIANNPTDLRMETVVFDGGTTGWSNQAAFNVTGTMVGLRATNIDLLNDSDMLMTTGSSGYVSIRNYSGSARVTWP